MFYPDLWVRMPLYIALGIVTEVLFTGIADLIHPHFLQSWNAKDLEKRPPTVVRRDPRAMGYTFLWMIPIYMLLAFLEPVSLALSDVPWVIRGVIYVIGLWIVEYTAGALIKKLVGHDPWDYSYSRFSFHGHIRWDFAPLWFVFTLTAEYMSHKFVQLTPAIKNLFDTPQ